MNKQVPVRIAFLPQRPRPDFSQVDLRHPIDGLTFAQFQQLRLQPSEPSTDSMFIRRAFLDACGLTPTVAEVRAFLADQSTNKREKLIDSLLARPEFASFWAQKWSDLLRNEEKSLDKKGVQVFYRWMRTWFAEDKPLNEFAREILAARGSTYSQPPANFYRAIRDPYQRAESAAQVFLGLRVSCAKCHNHPFDQWTQDDYHRFVAVFSRIDYRVLSNDRKDDLDKHEFVGEQIVIAKRTGDLPHPRGGVAEPKFLGSDSSLNENTIDRLTALADWVAAPENPFFARAQVNRIWFHLLGKGLVDPNDDFRASNPPQNPELLDHLTLEFKANGMRLKPIIRHIMLSKTYQFSSASNETNRNDESHFSRAIVQPLEAEQLIDSVAQVMNLPLKFSGYPLGIRAGEVAAPSQSGRRSGTESMGARFLKVFGKPERLLTCECERSDEGGMMQAFQLMTGDLISSMLRNSDNRLASLQAKPVSEALDELFLVSLCRYPTPNEREKLTAHLKAATNTRAAWEDIAWGVINSKEFLLRR